MSAQFELHSALAEQDPNLKMVIITGYPLEEISPEIINKGVAGLIRKPTDIATLSRSIRKALYSEISLDTFH